MNRRSALSIGGFISIGVALLLAAGARFPGAHPDWRAFFLLLGLTTIAQLLRVEGPGRRLLYASTIFIFAAVLLLPPLLLFGIITVPLTVEWIRERWAGEARLGDGYVQPLTAMRYWIAARAAREVYTVMHGHLSVSTARELSAVLVAGLVYVALNHIMLYMMLGLTEGASRHEWAVTDGGSLVGESVLICIGSLVAVLWMLDPWFILPALAPMVLIYQALKIPRLKQEAQTDAKTGLFNARHFAVSSGAELGRAQRFDRPLSFVMADLDLLREINNTYGHLAGDAVLQGVASIIRSSMRDYDIAGRFGGEEFSLVLPETDETQARAIAERLRLRIQSTPFTVPTSPTPIHVTMSIGVACYPHDGRTSTELMHAADRAVYAAKSAGRNLVVCTGDLSGGSMPPLDGLVVETRAPADTTRRGENVPLEGGGPEPTRHWARSAYLGGVILGGIVAMVLGLLLGPPRQPFAILLFTALAAVAELLEVDLYGRGTVSVSAGITFTAAMVTGVPGLLCVGGVIALVHHLKQRRGFSQLYRAVFNASAHVLAGLAVVGVLAVHPQALVAGNLPVLIPLAMVAGACYYVVETGLVAGAVALSEESGFLATWRQQYRWLAAHYVLLCLMGLILSVSYTEMGPLGAVVLMAPLFIMHYAQKLHMEQTREDVSVLQRLNRELASAAVRDHLTGLGNDRGYGAVLDREIEAAIQHGQTLTLVRLMVDDLRAINEQRGRSEGDRVVREVAAALRAASPIGLAFRLTGAEFAMVVRGMPAHAVAMAMEELRRGLEVQVSIGIASLDGDESDGALLNEGALEAMMAARRQGRGAVITFDEIRNVLQMPSSVQAMAVRRYLAERNVSVAVQPIWDVHGGTVLGYEALARFPHGEGTVGPRETFDAAERMGRSFDLDTVCREAILARANELPPDTRLFINVLPGTLAEERLPAGSLVDAVTHAGLRPDQVVLEVTEPAIIDLAALIPQAERLRTLGFKLALDGVGAGNASLSVLSRMQVDFVKIDRTVVTAARTDSAARATLAGVVAAAREMRAFVIAEGIETVETLELVHDIAVSRGGEGEDSVLGMQGYLLGRPGPWFLDGDMLTHANGAAWQDAGMPAFLQGILTARSVSPTPREPL